MEEIKPKNSSWHDEEMVPAGYLGNFTAAMEVNTSSTNSWADVSASDTIVNSDVTSLNLTKVLSLAKEMDGDIDGKSGGGSASVKEGEEKFICGASYSGMQGISISETAGLSASYTHGKNVSWVDGDKFTFQKGEKNEVNTDVEFSNSVTRTKQTNLTAKYSSGSIENINSAGGHIGNMNTTTLLTNTNISAATGNLNFAIGSSTANISALTANVNIAGFSYICNVENSSNLYNIALASISATNTAPLRLGMDNTFVSMSIYANCNYSVGLTSMNAFTQMATAAKVDLKTTDLEMTRNGAARVESLVTDIKHVALAQLKNNSISILQSKLDVTNVDVTVEEHAVALDQANIAIASGKFAAQSYAMQICS